MTYGLLSWWHQHLTAKITAVALGLLTVLTGVSTWLLTLSEQRTIREQMDVAGRSLLRAASIGCIEPLLLQDYPVLDTLTQALVHDRSDVVFVIVRRGDGTIVSQSPADACDSFDLPSHRVYSSPIQVGSEDAAALGTIAIGLTTRISDDFLATHVAGIAVGALLALVLLGLVLTRTIQRVIGEPLRSLDEQAVRLAGGDLNTPVHVSTRDELGRLASTLDYVRRNLRVSYSELQDQNRKLRQLDRIKDEFLANMSHEIRTPLTAILGFADLLLETVERHDERESVETIRRNGDHLLQVINDILDLSKSQAGKLHVARQTCSPHQIVAEVASLMRVRATAKDLRLDVCIEGPIPRQIHTDPTRLRQILLNLVGNAVKFTDRGGIRIALCLDQAQVDDGRMRFDVVDTGTVLEEAQKARLFEPFYQADSSMTRSHGGTGLGLAISQRLANQLGGEISVHSQPDQGNTFRLVISTGCLRGVEMVTDGAEASISRSAVGHGLPGDEAGAGVKHRGKVLLAEDGPDNQRLFNHILCNAGFDVTIADNGKIALERAVAAQEEGEPFNVVLMDIQMPIMDGYEATRQLRHAGYEGAIIAVTAHAMSNESEKCRQVGCNDCLTKPINPREFVATVSQYIADGANELTAHRS